MSMRIESGNVGTIGGSGSSGSVRSVGGDDASSANGSHGFSDTVSLSNASSLVAMAKNINSADRQSRVDSLTANIRSGNYRFSSGDVAQALLKQSI
jgi:anti-sigma28 factor (negative regulator of flagellin synthesis)